MNSGTPGPNDSVNPSRDPRDFSLALGGRFSSFWAGRVSPMMRSCCYEGASLVISLFAWLPLLALSALGRQMLGGGAAVPFLMDVEVHVKFLVVIPLLIVSLRGRECTKSMLIPDPLVYTIPAIGPQNRA